MVIPLELSLLEFPSMLSIFSSVQISLFLCLSSSVISLICCSTFISVVTKIFSSFFINIYSSATSTITGCITVSNIFALSFLVILFHISNLVMLLLCLPCLLLLIVLSHLVPYQDIWNYALLLTLNYYNPRFQQLFPLYFSPWPYLWFYWLSNHSFSCFSTISGNFPAVLPQF